MVSSRPVVTSDRAEQRVAAGKRHVRVGEKRRREGEGNTGNISSSLLGRKTKKKREREKNVYNDECKLIFFSDRSDSCQPDCTGSAV